MKIPLIPFPLAIALAATAHAQNLVVDGDLEGHSSTSSCNYNVSNSTFDSLYANVHSFGASGGIDIMLGRCMGPPSAQSGSTRLALAWNNASNGNRDAMALDLAAPLVPGTIYSLSFWAADMPFGTPQPFEVGISSSPSQFGTQVYRATATATTWTNFVTRFQAPSAGTHLTVRCPAGPDMWTVFDNFDLRPAQGVPATNTVLPSTCAGPTLAALSRPVIGTSWDFDWTPAGPGAVGYLLAGLSNPGLAFPSPPFSFGCTQFTDGSIVALVPFPLPTPAVRLSVPLDLQLVGLTAYAQAGVIRANPLSVSTSNGIEGRIGDV